MGWVNNNTYKDELAKKGMRIRMISMEDQHGVDEGLEGTIEGVDDLGTLHVTWDDGRMLGVIPGIDKYDLLPPSDEQIDFDVFEGSDFKLSKGAKKNKMGIQVGKNFKRALSSSRPKPTGIKVEAEEIKGGKAEGLTIQDIAKKHKVPIGDIKKEIKLGTKVEMEHTNSKVKAKEIAMDHLTEFHDFYSNEKHGAIASEKGLEKDLKETSITGGTSIKDEVQRILSTIKTAQYQHKDTVETMINNFYNKHKGRVSDVDKLTKIYTNLLDKLESKFNVDETSTGGGVSTGVFIGPLGGKDETIIKKPFAKQIGKEITGKKSISNPIGKIYTVTKKTEAKIISKKDLISELSSNSSSKLRDEGGSFDGDAWVGDEKGWLRKDELAWEGGEISDILAKMDINWTDSDLSLTDKETDKINEGWLIKSKEDKLVLSILKRVKQRLPEDAQFIDTRYGVWEEGDTVTFSLPGIKQNAKIEVKYSYSNTGSAYADIRVNGRDLPASKWVIKKLYYYFYKILSKKWEEKNIQNIESDLTDPNFAQDVFDILGDDNVNEGEKKKTKESPIHKKKWERCVKDVKEQNKKDGKDYNPYAVCTASIGYEGSIKKPHRRKEEEIEEATTHASVWGANGPPVVPIFGAKGKDHVPSRKPIFKGGKIVQKINNSGVLTEGIKESLLDEINKIKWVKGGKYVKIKDKCAKYNNQPWCSQGAIDSPLEFSDTVFESVGEISKVTGLSEEKILDKIKAKLKGVTPEQMDYNKEHGLPIWWKGSKEGFYEKMEPRKNYTGSN
tara:strand:- start:1507 stop:3855 length:2349 start_codon:yes stop_codon:yes gene_type:complete